MKQAPELAILLSGGIDSSALLAFYLSAHTPIEAIFVDYGQPAARPEESASAAVARYYGVELRVLRLTGIGGTHTGEIRSRNAFLAAAAAFAASYQVWGVALGVHAGTLYADSSPSFVSAIGAALSYQSRPVTVLAPFVNWHRPEILTFCEQQRIPLELTYSCEAGTVPPCGLCLSCQDREAVNARA